MLSEVGFDKYTQKLKEFMKNYDQEKEDKMEIAGNVAGVKRTLPPTLISSK